MNLQVRITVLLHDDRESSRTVFGTTLTSDASYYQLLSQASSGMRNHSKLLPRRL